MDFNDTPEEAAYRAEVRAWLEANAPKTPRRRRRRRGRRRSMAASKAWQAKKAAAGYAQITWPKEWGGQGGTPIQQVIFNQEEAKHPVPGNPFQIGLGMCVPTVMPPSPTRRPRTRFVGPALRGEEIWCQLFSEPSGGSDVAAARTKAVRAPRRLRRLADLGPEGVDDGRAVLRLRHRRLPHQPGRAQAQGPDDVQALVLGHVRVGAGDDDAEVGELGAAWSTPSGR